MLAGATIDALVPQGYTAGRLLARADREPMAEPSYLSDEELMARLARRDQRALEALYDRYARALYALALRLLGERSAAEEVVQECFLKVWHAPDRYQASRGRPLTWLLALAHHRAIDELRRRRNEQRLANASIDGEAAASTIIEGPETQVWSTLEREELARALAALPPAQQEVLRLAYFEGLTQTEIARHLGEPLGTIKTRVRLAMQKLRAATAAGQEEPRSNRP